MALLVNRNIMEGIKTFIGILISLLGALGLGEIISQGEAGVLVDSFAQFLGLAIAVYGRIKARIQY